MRQNVRTRITNHPAAVAATKTGQGTPTPEANPQNPTFFGDVQPLFAQFAGPMMWRLDLTDYDAVVGNAQIIYSQISTAQMPPQPFPAFTQDQITMFQTWMNNGFKKW